MGKERQNSRKDRVRKEYGEKKEAHIKGDKKKVGRERGKKKLG